MRKENVMSDIDVPKGSPMVPFYSEITKAFAEHSGKDEIITMNGPENHGGHGLHSQTNLINRSNGNCFKIRFGQ